MPITLDRDVRRRWLIAHATGALTIDEVIHFLRTARAPIEYRMWPLVVDARSCETTITDADVESAVAVVRQIGREGQQRGHVALIADDDTLYARFLLYETRCAEEHVRIIRVFRDAPEAEGWLSAVSAAREFG